MGGALRGLGGMLCRLGGVLRGLRGVLYRQTEIDLDDARGDPARGDGAAGVGLFKAPGEARPFAIGTGSGRAGAADKGDGVAAIDDEPVFIVDLQVVEQVNVAIGLEADIARFPHNGNLLRVDGGELRWRLLQGLQPPVFFRGDAKALIVGEGLAGMGVL